MVELTLFSPLLLFLLLLPLLIIFVRKLCFFTNLRTHKTTQNLIKSYPILGSTLAIPKGKKRLPWMTRILAASPTSTIVIKKPLWGGDHIVTSNPANVEHILKTKFPIYQKGDAFTTVLGDLLGHGIFNVDGDEWKFQRRVASHEFSNKSIRKFVEQVVDAEIENRLLPILVQSVDTGRVLDLQNLLRRFTFDNICKIAFDYDPALLLPSLPESPFATAFEQAIAISSLRFRYFSPIVWRIKRLFNVGSEKRLREAVSTVREFAAIVIKQKKSSPESNSDLDLLSRFLKSGHSDEKFVTDIAISFILAGRDTTSAGLTWFFWLLSTNPSVEREIVDEINRRDENPKNSAYEDAREMVYLHAALHESMRLCPPVVAGIKQVAVDDVLPDGTEVMKGTTVVYHVYAMGRMEKIWGEDCAEFRPERWLEEREDGDGRKKMSFSAKDPFSYPVFHAGPRVCLGKEMALLQMKRMAAAILRRFRVVPAVKEGFEPVLLPYLTAEMEGGLSSGSRVVYLCRDPRDTFVSLWHFTNKLRSPKDGALPLEEAFERFVRGVSLYGPFWDHVLGYWRQSLERPSRVMFLKYEEVKEDPRLCVRRLAEFLGCPFSPEEDKGGVVDVILELCSFENLSNLEVNKNGKLDSGEENKAFFRRGEVGDSKNYLTPVMVERLEKISEEKLGGSGLKF